MANLNTVTARASKTGNVTENEVRESLLEAYPDHKITAINDLGDEFEAVLTQEIRVAEFPPEKEDKPEKSEESDGPDEEPDSDSDDEGGESEGLGGGGEFDEKPKDPVKNIQQMLKELLVAVKKLEQKAGLIDEVHKKIKPHVEDLGDVGPSAMNPDGGPGLGGPEGGPGGPSGSPFGGPGGPEAGKRPAVPRRPYVPSGKPDQRVRNPAQRGQPSAFSNTRTKIAFVPVFDQGTKHSFEDAAQAVMEKFPEYKITGLKEDLESNRYVAKLELK